MLFFLTEFNIAIL